MHKMTKDTFKLEFDGKSETWYVVKNLDELMKNHKDIDQKVSGFMPEYKDDPLCPVCTYRMYLEHLHPDNNYLWQLALENINANTPDRWYGRQHLGKNTLGHFMMDVSKKCQLSKIYTNRSVQVTVATVLKRMHFSSAEIMSVTGHKSVQILTRYQRTEKKQKLSMGNVMHQSLTRQEDQIIVPNNKNALNYQQNLPQLQYPNLAIGHDASHTEQAVILYTPKVVESKENAHDNAIPFEPNFDEQGVPDFNLLQILKEVEEPRENSVSLQVTTMPTTTAMTSNNVLNNVPKSLFHNCTIQNITFNMSK